MIKLNFTALVITSFLFVGCSFNNLDKNEFGQLCVKQNEKTNLHTLIESVSKNSNSNYQYENEADSLDMSYLTFKDNVCFNNINELKSYIDNKTQFTLNINKNSIKAKESNKGISLNNTSIIDVIDFINSQDSSNKIQYLDENIMLENSSNKIYSFNDLKTHIQNTTPFYLRKVSVNPQTSNSTIEFYNLGYTQSEASKSFDNQKLIVENLNKAKQKMNAINRDDLSDKVNDMIKEINSLN